MHKLARVSGGKLVKILQGLNFSIIRQRGSHVRMLRKQDGRNHYVTVPLHPIIDRGTSRSIIRSISSCVSEETIQELFYS